MIATCRGRLAAAWPRGVLLLLAVLVLAAAQVPEDEARWEREQDPCMRGLESDLLLQTYACTHRGVPRTLATAHSPLTLTQRLHVQVNEELWEAWLPPVKQDLSSCTCVVLCFMAAGRERRCIGGRMLRNADQDRCVAGFAAACDSRPPSTPSTSRRSRRV